MGGEGKKKKKLKGKWREDWVTVVMVVMLVSVIFYFFYFWDKRDFVLCAMMCELDTCTGLDVGLNGVALFFFFYLFIFYYYFFEKRR